MIKIENITKQFGTFTAVREVSFQVEKGEIFGLLGENGAGKTTTLRMLATMLRPTSGTATMAGFDIVSEPEKVRSKIGILFGGETGLYDRLTCEENISYFGELNDMSKAKIDERIKILAKTFGMEEYITRRAGKLSKGMKQKVAFARSIIHDPDIMLFDEPTSGLDVSAIRDVHEFIRTCKKEGKTIVFSSHTMSEVEKLCDRIAIIHKGELIEKGKIDDIKEKYGSNDIEEIFIRLVGDKHES
ncbi:ABC transporter ATP-binding protein [Acetivibrio cellulolyticus]|uniref:ABC transporter ATP-binding protein n=1 Tax=Acetivibrio cellulolyticus TaxID=35830 RepID=UPI0002481BE8|nr:ATP-binding cassette domain-containing protein [Acetivibrio cellulolyticus]